MNSLQKTLLAAALGAALATSANAAVVEQVTNGDFSAGLTGWSAMQSISAATGAAKSTGLGQLFQTFTATVSGPYTVFFNYSTKSDGGPASAGWLYGTFSLGNTYIGDTGMLQGQNQSWSISPGNLVAGSQYVLTFFGSNYSVDNVSVAVTTPLPSPGPIAGAGLPVVLGLMGFAAWRRRQAA